MDKNKVTVYYDDENDILVIKLKEEKAVDTVELGEDIFALVNEKGEIVELEIWRAKELIGSVMAEKIAEKVMGIVGTKR